MAEREKIKILNLQSSYLDTLQTLEMCVSLGYFCLLDNLGESIPEIYNDVSF